MAPRSSNLPIRELPYIPKKSAATAQRIAEVCGTGDAPRLRMFLVGTSGPTAFIVKEADEALPDEPDAAAAPSAASASALAPGEGADSSAAAPQRPVRKYRVLVGSRQSCSCGGIAAGELCTHALFVMLKVLRVPRDNPLAWQLALVDAELETVLSYRARHEAGAGGGRKHNFLKRRTGGGGSGARPHNDWDDVEDDGTGDQAPGPATAGHPPLPTDVEDVCPVCLDALAGNEPLTYCANSCNNWVHVRCMIEFGEHNAPRDISCPLCREAWGGASVVQALKKRLQREKAKPRSGSKGSDLHSGSHCHQCQRRPIEGPRFRCVSCVPRIELCAQCFGRGAHNHHDCACKDKVGDAWAPAPRVKAKSADAWRPVGGLPPAALAALQFRDINPEDYASLMALDAGGAAHNQVREYASLGEYLAATLPRAPRPPAPESCAECDAAIDAEPGALYPCGHRAHRRCVKAAIDLVQRPPDAPARFSCRCCGEATHPGLFTRKKPEAAPVYQSDLARAAPQPLDVGGLSVFGSSTARGDLAEDSVLSRLTAQQPGRRRAFPTTALGRRALPAFDEASTLSLAVGASSSTLSLAVSGAVAAQESLLDGGSVASSARPRFGARPRRPGADEARGEARAAAAHDHAQHTQRAAQNRAEAAVDDLRRLVAAGEERREAAVRSKLGNAANATAAARLKRDDRAAAAAARRTALRGDATPHGSHEGPALAADFAADFSAGAPQPSSLAADLARLRGAARDQRLRDARQRRAASASTEDRLDDAVFLQATQLRSGTAPLYVESTSEADGRRTGAARHLSAWRPPQTQRAEHAAAGGTRRRPFQGTNGTHGAGGFSIAAARLLCSDGAG
ncbi:hypothetical protein M885DRAFT_613361 [Pelagophyceae sp. CCMP2097]|nr:hypothetical protein M885DRAFT_613361 [Pelagophyceae sp. CCMP2097]